MAGYEQIIIIAFLLGVVLGMVLNRRGGYRL